MASKQKNFRLREDTLKQLQESRAFVDARQKAWCEEKGFNHTEWTETDVIALIIREWHKQNVPVVEDLCQSSSTKEV